MAGQNNNKKFLIQFSMAKIPMLIIKSMGNASNIINSVFTIFFIPPPALNDNLQGFTPVLDENTGKMTGYKTTIGGADTVFPFMGNNGLQLLWENPNPGTAADTVVATCDYSDYQYLLVNLKEGTSNTTADHMQIIQPNITKSLPNIGLSAGYSRSIGYSDNQISFTTGAPGASGGNYTFPVRIYGAADISLLPCFGYS